MANIGGNITATIQTMASGTKNAIGEAENTWNDTFHTVGWLGLQTGENKRTFSAKIEESSHVFLCDFNADIYALADQNTRMVIKGCVYDVTFIDNPDELDEQLEIFLRKVGGQNG